MNGHPVVDTGAIPHIDLSAFGDQERGRELQGIADQLGAAAAQYGCAAITGHGIAPQRLAEAFEMTRRLYSLSDTDKLQARRPDSVAHHRGWSAPGREHAAGKEGALAQDAAESKRLANVADYKESYEIGSEQNDEQSNVWLPEETLPGFRAFMAAFYWELHGAALRVLDALILSLNLAPAEQEALCELHGGHYSQLRLAHYLPVSEELARDENTFRLAAHRDFGSFTILFQDGENSGLEFQDPATGEWMLAPPSSGVLYLNIADVFDRLSNGRYPSANHRVIAPLGDKGRREMATSRYSIVLFVAPKGSQVVEPVQSLVKADGKQTYEPMTFMEYCMKMMAATQQPS